MVALRKQAEILAEERRLAREQALEWSREVKMESDEERERKAKKSRRVKTEGASGDEAPELKKKRKGRTKKEPEGEEQTLFSDEDGKPAKKVSFLTSVNPSLSDRNSDLPRNVRSEMTMMKELRDHAKNSCGCLASVH